MTVNELYERCKEEIENGNGERDIILCVNDYELYPLEGGFSSPVYNDDTIYAFLEEYGAEEDSVIVLN